MLPQESQQIRNLAGDLLGGTVRIETTGNIAIAEVPGQSTGRHRRQQLLVRLGPGLQGPNRLALGGVTAADGETTSSTRSLVSSVARASR